MVRLISVINALLAVLMCTLCEGAEDIWLNELKITDTAGAITLQVELVGRPAITDFPLPPTGMSATVQFFKGPADTDTAGGPLTVSLSPSSGDWDGNYVSPDDATTICSAAECANAIVADGTRGLKLSYTSGGDPAVKLYCWGNAGNVGGSTCIDFISAGSSVPNTNSFIDWALYGLEANWAFAASILTAGSEPFATIGDLNECPAEGDCGSLVDQGINGFEYPPVSTNEDEVWLNELNVNNDGSSVQLEIVGAPKVEGKAADGLPVKVTFYSNTAELTPVADISLAQSESGGWNGHYQGSDDAVTGFQSAFPTGEVGGLQLSWGDEDEEKAVYCWGTGASLDSEIGETGKRLQCQNVVKSRAEIVGQSRGLYNWEQGDQGTPEDGGKHAKDFYWADSKKTGGDFFETIGTTNVCAEVGGCVPDDQQLDKYEGGGESPPSPPDEVVSVGVWLNELKVSLSSGTHSLEVEVVGQPPMEYPTAPDSVKVNVQFFTDDKYAGDSEDVTLSADATSWGGNYVGQWTCDSACTAAGDSDKLSGVKLTYDWGSKVYCWGEGAEKEAEIGPDEDECDIPIGDYSAPTEGAFVDHALYGTTHGTWAWDLSKTATTDFDTLGKPNACSAASSVPDDCDNSKHVQTVEPYVYSVPDNDNTDEVWLNELDITVGNNEVTAKLEIVGGLTSDTEVEVKFYLGDDEVKSESDQWKPVELVKSGESEWNSHYVGTVDVPADLGTAFPSTTELAGLQLKWGEKTAVYCWGSTAAIDSELGEDKVQCKTVVKTGGPIRGAGDGKYNRALFNWSETPVNGGKSTKDFYWTDSKDGGAAFASIGDVNVCPENGNCIPENQKLGLNGEEPPVEKEPTTTTQASSSVSLLSIGSWRSQAAVLIGLMITVLQCV